MSGLEAILREYAYRHGQATFEWPYYSWHANGLSPSKAARGSALLAMADLLLPVVQAFPSGEV
eukprot:12047537-Alexandrium_andersonii.AAC.1